MARKTIELLICDHCGQAKDDVEPRKLTLPKAGPSGRNVSFDACKDCRDTVPLSRWEELIPAKPTKGKTTRLPLVVSEADVLAAAKKKPAKRVVKKASRR